MPFLYENNLSKYALLMMRPNGNKMDSGTLKLKMFELIKPDIIFDDDPVACKMFAKAGYTVLQVHGYRAEENSTDRIPC
jgi:hypothetical protein